MARYRPTSPAAVAPLPRREWADGLDAACMAASDGKARLDLNIFGTVAHRPAVLAAWLGAGAEATSLAAKCHTAAVVERVILWTAAACRSRYVAARHRLIASALGVSATEIDALHRSGDQLTWPSAVALDAGLLPLVEFYAFACLVAEILDVQPDADIAADWPARPASGDWVGRAQAVASLCAPISPAIASSRLRSIAGALAVPEDATWPRQLAKVARSPSETPSSISCRAESLGPAADAVLAALGSSTGPWGEKTMELDAGPGELVDAAVVAALAVIRPD